MAAAGIWNHMAAGQALTGASATPRANAATGSGSSDTSTSSSSSSTISSNDFLTLLVTEMQNQDPTADTDPNEYINQLVQVNSLEQLIDINQNLSTALGDSSTSGSSGGAVPATGGADSTTATAATAQNTPASQHKAAALAAAKSAVSSLSSQGTSAVPGSAARRAPGNLSVPDADPAAQKVAHALNGKSHSRSISGRLPGAQ
jgi:flagellar basal-body rod modification protein FlgD